MEFLRFTFYFVYNEIIVKKVSTTCLFPINMLSNEELILDNGV